MTHKERSLGTKWAGHVTRMPKQGIVKNGARERRGRPKAEVPSEGVQGLPHLLVFLYYRECNRYYIK